jgi:nucleoside-diphosphate-sugar epimerase
MRVAITGASGYLGVCVSEAFRRRGHEVLSLSRRQCGEDWIPYFLKADPRQLPLKDVDVMIHAAYDFTPRHRLEIIDANVVPSISLFKAAADAKIETLIFISSMSSFEGCRSDYGKTKLMIEKQVLDLGGTVIRPGLVWGEHSGGVMAALEKAVAFLPVVPFPSGGTNAKQFLIHQADLSEAIVSIAENPMLSHQNVQSLANATPLTLRSILQIISSRKQTRRTFFPVPWPFVMAGLRAAEVLNVRLPFRSDSLVGLIHGNPTPEICDPPAGVTFRQFA